VWGISGSVGLRPRRAGQPGRDTLQGVERLGVAIVGCGASILIDQGPHYVHLLRRLVNGSAGEITHASALATGPKAPAAAIDVRFASGLIGELLLAWNVPTPPSAAVDYAFGTLGSLEVDRRDAALVVYDAAGQARLTPSTENYLATVAGCIVGFLRAASGQTARGRDVGRGRAARPGSRGRRATLDRFGASGTHRYGSVEQTCAVLDSRQTGARKLRRVSREGLST
jgi:hypothetical protein